MSSRQFIAPSLGVYWNARAFEGVRRKRERQKVRTSDLPAPTSRNRFSRRFLRPIEPGLPRRIFSGQSIRASPLDEIYATSPLLHDSLVFLVINLLPGLQKSALSIDRLQNLYRRELASRLRRPLKSHHVAYYELRTRGASMKKGVLHALVERR
jgi:hypothetical protein